MIWSTCVKVAVFVCTLLLADGVVSQSPVIVFQPKSILFNYSSKALEGQSSVTFSCNSTNSPSAKVSWSIRGVAVASNSSNITITSSSTSSFVFAQLTLTKVTRNDNGAEVKCTSINTAGNASSSATIKVQVGPSVSANTSSIDTTEHSLIGITCTADGFPAPSILWQENGQTIAGQTGSVLTVRPKRTTKNYACQATNAVKTTTVTISASISYLDQPVLESNIGFTIKERTPATLTCRTNGSAPIEYTFLNGTSELQKGMSEKYTLSTPLRLQDGSLTCSARNSAGTKTSAAASLVITYLDQPVLTSSEGLTVKERASTLLTCNVAGSDPISYQFFNDSRLISGKGQNSKTFKLSSPLRFQGGSFSCRATNGFGTQTSAAVAIVITYLDKPTLTSSTGISVKEGTSASLTCKTNGLAPLTYMFFKNGVQIAGPTSVNQFKLPPAQRLDNGNYTCASNNSFGTLTSDVLMLPTIYLDAPRLTSSSGLNLVEGTKATLTCLSNGSTPISYTFRANGTVVQGPSADNTFTTQAGVRYRDTTYSCTSNNSAGSESSQNVKLSVLFAPKAVANVSRSDVRLGHFLAVHCNSIGNPRPTVTWKLNNILQVSGSGMATLTLASAKSEQNGTYACEASNSQGKYTFLTEITVLAPPGPPTGLTVSGVTSKTLVLSWNEPAFLGNRPVNQYEIEQRVEPGGVWKASDCSRSPCQVAVRTVTIRNLNPFTNYSFRINASNLIGESLPSAVKGPTLTEEDAPGPARNLKLVARTTTTVSVAWEVPSVLNGVVEYLVLQRELNPIASIQTTVYRGPATSFVDKNLHEFTLYEYVVIAFNKKRNLNGTESNKIPIRTLSAKPSGPPLTLVLSVQSPTSIKATWQPPSQREQNGVITSYNILYNMTSSHIFTTNTPGNVTTVTLNRLNESEIYSVRVQAVNVNGTGPLSGEKRAETHESAPSAPVSVLAIPGTSILSVDINVTWAAPVDPNGILLGYRIFLQQETRDTVPITVPERDVNVSSRVHQYTFVGVDAFSKFRVSVSANTSAGFGPRSVISNVTSRQDIPMPVRGLRVKSFASRMVTLEWTRPVNFFGILSQYYVQFRRTGQSNLDTFSCTSPMLPTCTVTGLAPFADYTFQVLVRNGFGFSPPVSVSQKTAIDRPPVIPDSVVVKPNEASKTHNTFVVNITDYKFSDANGPIMCYEVVIIRLTNSSKPNPSLRQISSIPDYATAVKGSQQPLMYVTGAFNASEFQNFQIFTVGDKRKTTKCPGVTKRRRRNTPTEFDNVPLDAESYYTGYIRGFVNNNLFSPSPFFEPIRTGPVPVVDEGSNTGAIVGAVIGVLLAIALIIVIVAYVMRRRRQSKDEEDSDMAITSDRSSKKAKHLSTGPSDPRVPIPKSRFGDHVNSLKSNGGFGFSQEYSMIDRNLIHPYKFSAEPFNNLKNRYANVPAYDHSRVELEVLDDTAGSDYVNANYIEGYDDPVEYIAAQGPIPETVPDFWRMVWERRSKTIVMLTQLEEKGRTKCAKYWPDSGSVTYRDFVVTSLEVLEFPDHVIRTLHLTRTGYHDERVIKQFHFIAWPDFGVPEPSPLLSLLRKVNSWRLTNPSVAIIHCSAGVGRTGSYIVIDTQLKKMKKESNLNVFMNVVNIRDQRCLMVQTEDQYIFVHDAILEFIESGNSEIPASDLRDYIKTQSQISPEKGMTGLTSEFIKLAGGEKASKYIEANRPVNQNKNRYKNIYPFDHSRVKLSQLSGIDGSDYINANYIDGYTGKNAFIATQAPIPSTIPDFWRMIWEQNCRTVVALSKEFEAGKVKIHVYWPYDKNTTIPRSKDDSSQMDTSDPRAKAYPYWPNNGSIKVEGFIIETINSSHSGEFITRELKLTNTQFGVSRVVNHFQYVAWPENGSPESGFALIELIGHVQKWNVSAGAPPIVVHCSAGVGRTGVFIGLTNLVERLKSEGVIDVFQTVKQLRRQRTAMVQTTDQYEFCYRALQEYLDSFDLYANFN